MDKSIIILTVIFLVLFVGPYILLSFINKNKKNNNTTEE
jgi:preprotein translocase subunit SecG